MAATRSLTRYHHVHSDSMEVAACVKHSGMDASKFLSPSLDTRIDSQSLRQLTSPLQAPSCADKYFYFLEAKMQLKYFLERVKE